MSLLASVMHSHKRLLCTLVNIVICICHSYSGGVMSKSDMAEVMAEIYKVDRNFRMEEFLRECQLEVVPHILEAYLRGDLDVLKDWCHEAVGHIVFISLLCLTCFNCLFL